MSVNGASLSAEPAINVPKFVERALARRHSIVPT